MKIRYINPMIPPLIVIGLCILTIIILEVSRVVDYKKKHIGTTMIVCGTDTLTIDRRGNIDVTKVRSTSGYNDEENDMLIITINQNKK